MRAFPFFTLTGGCCPRRQQQRVQRQIRQRKEPFFRAECWRGRPTKREHLLQREWRSDAKNSQPVPSHLLYRIDCDHSDVKRNHPFDCVSPFISLPEKHARMRLGSVPSRLYRSFESPEFSLVKMGQSYAVVATMGQSYAVVATMGQSYAVVATMGQSYAVVATMGQSYAVVATMGQSYAVVATMGQSYAVVATMGQSYAVVATMGQSYAVVATMGQSYAVVATMGQSYAVVATMGQSYAVYDLNLSANNVSYNVVD